MSVCRVCIRDIDAKDPELKNIFRDSHNGKFLYEMLESVVQEQVNENDPGPHLICQDCYDKLTTCFDFLTTYSQSKIVFQLLAKSKLFKNTTKEDLKRYEAKRNQAIQTYKNKRVNAQKRQQKKIKNQEEAETEKSLLPIENNCKDSPDPCVDKTFLDLTKDTQTIMDLDLNCRESILYCNYCNFAAGCSRKIIDHVRADHPEKTWTAIQTI